MLHSAQRKSLHESEKRLAEIRATLDAARTREEQLAAELSRFAEIRTTLQAGLRERERLEKVAEATTFIRETLKEAAPRVARNYVYHVSIEAAQMFREIIGDAEKTLRWNEDYSITLEQGSFERPFTSLSGGEQYAALAVRLALLNSSPTFASHSSMSRQRTWTPNAARILPCSWAAYRTLTSFLSSHTTTRSTNTSIM